jgi:hypothetical protein
MAQDKTFDELYREAQDAEEARIKAWNEDPANAAHVNSPGPEGHDKFGRKLDDN